MAKSIRVIHLGVGPMGRRVVRMARERKGISVVGAVDTAPELIGRDLGEVSGVGKVGVTIAPDIRTALGKGKADVAIITTVSDLKRMEAQIERAARAGLDVVSTCEELSYPWETDPARSRRIDNLCRKHGVTCLGTGVNPGFLMDLLPCVLTAVARNITRIRVTRVQDASDRRVPFQQKIGAGLTAAEFRRKKKAGTLRHVGLTESVHMIARAVGWKLKSTTETIRPVIADEIVTTGYVPIEAGMARGVYQVGCGYVGRRKRITLEFRAAVGEPESYDRIVIAGDPVIDSTIRGGVNGDVATCAIVLNAVRVVHAAGPGLKTMLDIPPITLAR